MNNMPELSKARIRQFFAERISVCPEVEEAGSLQSVMSLEKHRARLFSQTMEERYVSLNILPSTDILATLYWAGIADYSAVLAFYNDETILWLDDHSNNSDFETFLQREKLKQWVPNRVDQLCKLFVATKFSFLGTAFLVQTRDDVPQISAAQQILLIENDLKDHLDAGEKKLSSVASKIHAPTLSIMQDETRLDFCLWIREFGRLLELKCFLRPDNKFVYEGNNLAYLVGDCFIPH